MALKTDRLCTLALKIIAGAHKGFVFGALHIEFL
jgi:hypothetical protein